MCKEPPRAIDCFSPGFQQSRKILKTTLAPSKILDENKLELRAFSEFLNTMSFDSKSTSEYCIKLRNA
jgi:hypothetical protein